MCPDGKLDVRGRHAVERRSLLEKTIAVAIFGADVQHDLRRVSLVAGSRSLFEFRGAKPYDRVTDVWIRRWLVFTLAPAAVVSATLHLPIEGAAPPLNEIEARYQQPGKNAIRQLVVDLTVMSGCTTALDFWGGGASAISAATGLMDFSLFPAHCSSAGTGAGVGADSGTTPICPVSLTPQQAGESASLCTGRARRNPSLSGIPRLINPERLTF